MPLVQEAVISCVREDKTGTEGCYSQSECGNTGSHCFLLLINLSLPSSPVQAQGTNWNLLRKEITEDNSKQTEKLASKELDLEKVVHRCFQELIHPRGSSYQRNHAGQQRVPLCHSATGVSLGGDGFPPRSSRLKKPQHIYIYFYILY